jgi:hypothetical protein
LVRFECISPPQSGQIIRLGECVVDSKSWIKKGAALVVFTSGSEARQAVPNSAGVKFPQQ